MFIEFNKLINRLPGWTRINQNLEFRVLAASVFISTLLVLVFLIIFQLLPISIIQEAAYSGTYEWTMTDGGAMQDSIADLEIDNNNNIVVIGSYSDTVDFANGAGSDPHTSNGYNDVFLSKYDSSGNQLWTATYGGIGDLNYGDDGSGIAIDSSNNIYSIGRYTNSIDILPDQLTITASSEYSPGWRNNVIDGLHGSCNNNEWSTAGVTTGWIRLTFDTPVTIDRVDLYDRACGEQVTSGTVSFSNGAPVSYGVLENSGTVPTTLSFSSRTVAYVDVSIDTSTGGSNVGLSEIELYSGGNQIDLSDLFNSANGYSDIVITKHNTDGTLQWIRNFGGVNTDYAAGVAVDNSGGVYFSGDISDTTDFDDSGGNDTLTVPGPRNAYITKYDTSGNYQWTRVFGGANHWVLPGNITTDSSGDVYVSGYIYDLPWGSPGTFPVDFDGTAGTDNRYIDVTDNGAAFTTKYNSDGSYGWTRLIDGGTYEEGTDVVVNSSGEVFSVGMFEGTVDFDDSGATDNLVASATDFYITKYSSAGVYQWTKGIGGTGNESALGIDLEADGDPVIMGTFQNTVDFDANAGTDNVSATVPTATFIVNYNADGSYGWGAVAYEAETNYGENTQGLDVDSSGFVYVGGSFLGSKNFDGTGGTDVHASNGFEDFYITKYNPGGSPPPPTPTPDYPAYDWTRTFGNSSNNDLAGGVGAFGTSGVLATGGFQGTTNFDDTGGTDNKLGAQGSQDVFITKYNTDGTYGWTREWGTGGTDFGSNVVMDNTGNSYSVGLCQSGAPADFDDTGGTDLRCGSSNGGTLTRYNSNGSYGWTRAFGTFADSVALDASGNPHVVGIFSGTLNFDDTGGTDNHTADVFGDVFLTKYNSDGSYSWTTTFGATGSSPEVANDAVIDSGGNIYVVGYFSTGSTDFGGTSRTSNGGRDAYLAKYDNTGSLVWVRAWGGTGNDSALGVALDSSGNPYVSGHFESMVNFNDVGLDNHTSNGNIDFFITKYMADGSYGWTQTNGSAGNDHAVDVSLDNLNNVYYSGYFTNTVDFNTGAGIDNHVSNGSEDAFVTKLTSAGIYKYTLTWGGSSNDSAVSISVVDENEFFIGGEFADAGVNFDATGGTDSHSTNGAIDMFISKYTPSLVAPPTSTPMPTNTPAPTFTPMPTNTPAPTNTPIPGITTTPTPTPVIILTPTPGGGGSPTATPNPGSGTITPTPGGGGPTSTPVPTLPTSDVELYQILNLDTGLDAEDINERNIEFGSPNGLVGIHDVILIDTEENIVIARFLDANFTHDLDWDNLKSDLSQAEGKSFVEYGAALDGFTDEIILFVPRSSDDEGVVYCPSASSFATISVNCEGGIVLIDGVTISGVTANATQLNGFLVWQLTGIDSGGGGSIEDATEVFISVTPTPDDGGNTTPVPTISGLPDTGGEDSGEQTAGNIINSILNLPVSLFRSIGAAIAESSIPVTPVVMLLPITGMGIATAISYPRFLLYGIVWYKGRKKHKPWGIIYDSTNKKPVPFASVKLYQDGVFVTEEITNLEGQYGFAVNPGSYSMTIEVPGFKLNKQELNIAEESVVALDVGLTSGNLDQQKKSIGVTAWIKGNLDRINTILVTVGFLFSILAFLIAMNIFNILVLVFYFIQFTMLVVYRILARRDWGYIYNSETKERISGAFVRIFDIEEGRQLDVKMSDTQGRYRFLLSSGTYRMKVDYQGYTFPAKQQRNVISTQTGEKFVEFNIQKGKPVNISLGLDPS